MTVAVPEDSISVDEFWRWNRHGGGTDMDHTPRFADEESREMELIIQSYTKKWVNMIRTQIFFIFTPMF